MGAFKEPCICSQIEGNHLSLDHYDLPCNVGTHDERFQMTMQLTQCTVIVLSTFKTSSILDAYHKCHYISLHFSVNKALLY